MDKLLHLEKKIEEVEGEKNKHMVKNCVHVDMYLCFKFLTSLHYMTEI